jgi:DNA-binding transcriptional MocR family regulator
MDIDGAPYGSVVRDGLKQPFLFLLSDHGEIDVEPAAKAAVTRDVEVTPLSRYGRGHKTQEGLQLGFAAVDAAEIRRGIRELALALEEESRALQRRGR